MASACSTKDDAPPVIRTVTVEREIPAEAKKRCADPVTLPDRRLSETETTDLWGRDRTALRVCETRRAAGASAGGPQ
ncbi:MAG: hypothetical protein DI589_27700 [Shinella sp.]|nr:MAG: hypothetical protein DI589_27700 [Shinella sp.]